MSDHAPPAVPGDRVPRLTGLFYTHALAAAHAALRPATYLEIGVEHGETLRLAACASIGVDPQLKLTEDVVGKKPACLLFQSESDAFFAQHDPTALLGGPIAFAFLDGMHWYEHVLRDFANTERHCARHSVIVLHDCVPTDVYMARRDRYDEAQVRLAPTPGDWTGDVWKALLLLRRHRPDLDIVCLDAVPTGLVLIGNLDPGSRVLAERHHAMVAELAGVSLMEYGIGRYVTELNLHDAGWLTRAAEVAARFGR